MKTISTKTRFVILLFLTGIVIGSCTKQDNYNTYEWDGDIEVTGKIVTNIPDEFLGFDVLQSSYKKGDKLKLRINRTGQVVEEYEIVFDGTYDFGGERLVFCKTPKGLIIGAGDSGSPILTSDGKVVAVLCYGFSFANNQFAARAIEDVLEVGSSNNTSSLKSTNSMDFKTLEPVYQVHGMNQQQFQRYTRNDEEGIFSKYNQFGTDRIGSNMKSSSEPAQLIPGNSISVQEISGTVINFVATGTASYISDNNVYGFGHSYSGIKPLAMPVFMANMITMIESDMEAYKISIPTDISVGAMTYDEFEGILIRTDIEPAKFDYTTTITIDGEAINDLHQVAQYNDNYREIYHAVNLGPYLLFRYLYEEPYTWVRVTGNVSIVFESGSLNYSFNFEDDPYWIDYLIASNIQYELENISYSGHITSVNFSANVTDLSN